jgi:hypothetical protein
MKRVLKAEDEKPEDEKVQEGGVFKRPGRGGPNKPPPPAFSHEDLLAAATRLLERERLQEREFNQAITDAITAHNGTQAGALAASAMVQPLATRAIGTRTRRSPRGRRPTKVDVGAALETLAVHQGLRGSARSVRQSHAEAERAVATLEHFMSTPPANLFAGLRLAGPAPQAPTAAGTAFTFAAGPAQVPPGGFSFGSPPKRRSPPKTGKKTKKKSPPRKSPPKTRKKPKSPSK